MKSINDLLSIFPEGTRSKTGVPKEFAQTGFGKFYVKMRLRHTLCRSASTTLGKLLIYGFFPVGLGNHLTFTAHAPISVAEVPFEELMKETEKAVKEGIKN